ncbi:hypothetical protein GCM10022409_22780 [Hymenobacter glaciei]|uniref:histidine kinase n=1 Tax=Hymenobacter glaciei TaxID=877209 RepID=A0ABP7U7J8_9BACT
MVPDATPDSSVSSPPFPAALLPTLLAVSLSAVNLLRPVYGPGGPEIVDFSFDYLNPAAQRITGLPERPGTTALARFPEMVVNGVFDFYRRTYQSGEPGTFDVNRQSDGLDNYFRLAAQRCEDLLVVSFADTADHPRTPVEEALRAAQAAEQTARADAEAQRQRLHDVLLDLPAFVATYRGPAHTYEYVNRNFQQALPGRSLVGRTVREALPEEGQAYLDLLGQVYQTGEPFQGQEVPSLVDYTGTGQLEQRYHNFYVQATRDPAGTIDGLLSFSYDVTEQVEARQQLHLLNQELEARVFERTHDLRHAQAEAVATAQRLLRITESLPSTTFTVDQAGQVLYISPQWYAYTGMDPGASVNEVWPTLIHPDDLPVIAREFGAALAEGRPWRYEFRLRGAAGHYRWFASQGEPEPLAEAEQAGRPRQWFGSNLDIDDLKQAQYAREQQEQRLTNILTSLPASVVTCEGEELRLTFFNDTFQQFALGRAVLGRTLGELFPEAVEQGYTGLVHGVLRTGEPFRASEVTSYVVDPRTGARKETFLDLTYLPLRHGTEPPHAVLTFSLDVTERVHARRERETQQLLLLAANEALTESNHRLTRTNNDLDTFIYTASHDLKTPISNLEGLLHALREEIPPELLQGRYAPRLLGHMQGAVDRFKLTIAQLTDISRLQRASTQPVESVDLATLVADVRLDLAPQLAADARLVVDVAACPRVTFAPKNLRSIVFNLLSNAFKYRHPARPPHVELRCHCAEDGTVVLDVQDNGLGLTHDQQGQLFGLFRRLHDHVEGSGVGLYMVKRIAENAGGTIAVQSTPDVGTTFTVMLPAPARAA